MYARARAVREREWPILNKVFLDALIVCTPSTDSSAAAAASARSMHLFLCSLKSYKIKIVYFEFMCARMCVWYTVKFIYLFLKIKGNAL